MKGFTGKLVIQFTAKVRSVRDLDRRIAKVMSVAERHIGGEFWEVHDLRVLPGPIPFGYYGVELCTVGNPDHGQTSSPVPPEWVVVKTMSEAKAAVRAYLERNAGVIGGGNWGPDSGQVWDHQGEVVARFSFNLRCWAVTSGEGNGEELEVLP
jgi:hypothetical protein